MKGWPWLVRRMDFVRPSSRLLVIPFAQELISSLLACGTNVAPTINNNNRNRLSWSTTMYASRGITLVAVEKKILQNVQRGALAGRP
jgi:hypothetical protein